MIYNIRIERILFAYALLAVMFLSGHVAATENWPQCEANTDDRERLRCYDTFNAEKRLLSAQTRAGVKGPRSYLERSWDLDNLDEELLGENQSPLRPHRVSYLIVRRTGQSNVQPFTPTHMSSVPQAEIDLTELKFQISQKAKILNPVSLDFMGFTGVRLWGAYTQQSNWQAFNADNSSPFRETNYEPELIITFRTNNRHGFKLLNLGYAHQSNGRDANGSRSWNRTFLQGGWETDTLAVLMRCWWRIPENAATDDNPDIEDYAGRGDISLRWEPSDRSQVIDLTLRNNFQAGWSRGFAQLDWAMPVTVSKSTKLHLQLTSGYGESLVDYNYFQTTLGLGVSFRDW